MAIYGKKYLIEHDYSINEGALDFLIDKANNAIDTSNMIKDLVAKQKEKKEEEENKKYKFPLMQGSKKEEKKSEDTEVKKESTAIFGKEYITESLKDKYYKLSRKGALDGARRFVREAGLKSLKELKDELKIMESEYNSKIFDGYPDEKKELKELIDQMKDIIDKRENGNKQIHSDITLDDDTIDKIYSCMKHIVSLYNKDSSIKEKILKNLSEFDDRKTNYKFKPFICDIFEQTEDEVVFEICDQDQIYCQAVGDIIQDIGKDTIKEVKKKYNISVSFTYGDGDEGCIYLQN